MDTKVELEKGRILASVPQEKMALKARRSEYDGIVWAIDLLDLVASYYPKNEGLANLRQRLNARIAPPVEQEEK